MTFGVGPDELDVAGLADLGEIGALGEEPVAGMNRVGAGDLRRAQHGRDAEVAVGAARRADADVFVGEPHVQGVLVGLRIDRDGLDAELAAGADHPQGDLAAVGDEDFLEHAGLRGLDREEPLAVLDGLAVLDVDAHDLSFVLRSDLVHELHRFDDAEHLILLHVIADVDERRRARLGRSVERPDDRRLHHRELELGVVGRQGAAAAMAAGGSTGACRGPAGASASGIGGHAGS